MVNQYWAPRCPTCGSYEVDFTPFTDGQEWECESCGMKFEQEEEDDVLYQLQAMWAKDSA